MKRKEIVLGPRLKDRDPVQGETGCRMRRVASGVLLVALLGGCAARTLPAPPSQLRSEMQTVSLHVSAPSDRLSELDKQPVAGSGEGAGYGAGQGAMTAVGGGVYLGGAFGCHPMWNVFIIITCPAGLLGGLAAGAVAAIPAAAAGAAIGADKAKPEEQVAQAGETFRDLARENDPAGELNDHLERQLRERLGVRLASGGSGGEPGAKLDFEINMGLKLVGRLDPDLQAAALVKGYVRRAPGKQASYERTWHYARDLGKYFALLEGDGDRLKGELQRFYAQLAQQIVTDLYITSRGDQRPGSVEAQGQVVTLEARLGPDAQAMREVEKTAPAPSTPAAAPPGPEALRSSRLAPEASPAASRPAPAPSPRADEKGWSGRWSGESDEIAVSFSVEDDLIKGGTAKGNFWNATFSGSVRRDGHITGKGTVRFASYGRALPVNLAGTLPELQFLHYSGQYYQVQVARQ